MLLSHLVVVPLNCLSYKHITDKFALGCEDELTEKHVVQFCVNKQENLEYAVI